MRCGLVALAGTPGPHLAPAHGHGVYKLEEFFGGDGLRGAELLAAILADEDDGEGAPLYAEPASRGRESPGVVLQKRLGQEIPLPEGGLPTFEEAELAGVGLVVGRGGEDEEAAVGGRGVLQDCSRARSSVCWAAAA